MSQIPKTTLYKPEITIFNKIQNMPKMIETEECQYIYEHMKNTYLGYGEALDLGSWLGVSAVCAAIGLMDNPFGERKVHTFDRFTWEDYMIKVLHNHDGQERKPITLDSGDSFREAYDDIIEPYEDRIVTHQCDLSTYIWNKKPIEYLFVDAFKTRSLVENGVIQFFPCLVRGSYVLHQDFTLQDLHGFWLHIINYRLREFFRPVYDIGAWTIVFQTINKPSVDVCEAAVDFSDVGREEVKLALEYSRSLIHTHPEYMDKLYENYLNYPLPDE